MRGRGSERGWGSVWSSQPGLLSHLQPLSLFYTQIHTRAHTQYTFSLSHTHTHVRARTGWQPHDTATTHHSMPLLYPLNHSFANHMQINIPLSSGHIHHVNNKIHHFARLPHRSCDKLEKVWQFLCCIHGMQCLLLSNLERFSPGIIPLLIKCFSKWPKLMHSF